MKVNKTFSLDHSLIIELKKLRNRNGGLRNKSAFINAAGWEKLHRQQGGVDTVTDLSTKKLMAVLHARDDCDQFLKRVLMQQLSRLPQEHTGSNE